MTRSPKLKVNRDAHLDRLWERTRPAPATDAQWAATWAAIQRRLASEPSLQKATGKAVPVLGLRHGRPIFATAVLVPAAVILLGFAIRGWRDDPAMSSRAGLALDHPYEQRISFQGSACVGLSIDLSGNPTDLDPDLVETQALEQFDTFDSMDLIAFLEVLAEEGSETW